MSHPLPDWTSLYQAYDTDSLITFASAGLLRRAQKEVDGQKVLLLAQTAQHLQFENDGQQIRLDAHGIQKAQCNCPAQACCKHILAAVLYLQSCQEVVETQLTEQAGAEPASTPAESALEEILSLNAETTLKKIPKAVLKLAYAFQQDWQQHPLQLMPEGSRLKILLPAEPLGQAYSVLYIYGAGVGGMLSDIEAKYQLAAHLAVIAEVFRLHDKVWDWGPGLSSQNTPTANSLNQAELQIIQQTQQLIEQLISLGLSHLDSGSSKQCRLLNMSARAEGLVLLAAYLRNLHGQIESLVSRDEHSSERQIMLQLALVYSYCYQLQLSQGENLLKRRGRSRQTYQHTEQKSLLLQPLGAHWWQTAGGARGLTVSFWDIQNNQIVESSLARPNGMDPTFYPVNAWKQHAIWKRTPQQLMQRAFTLHRPRFSDNERIAATGDSEVMLDEALGIEQLNSFGIHSWELLQQQLQHSILHASDSLPTRWLLRITAYQQPSIDELEQCIWWCVQDAYDRTLHLRLDWNDDNMQRIEQLELCCAQQLPINAVLVQHQVNDSGWLMLNPLSLLIEQDDTWRVFNLDFDRQLTKRAGLKSNPLQIMGRIKLLLQRKQQQQGQQKLLSKQTLAQKTTEPLLDLLDYISATGRLSLTVPQQQQLAEQIDLAQQAGLDYLAETAGMLKQTEHINPSTVLKLAYLCERLQQLQRRLIIS